MLMKKRENELKIAERMFKNAELVCNDLQEKIKMHLEEEIKKDKKLEKLQSEVEEGVAM